MHIKKVFGINRTSCINYVNKDFLDKFTLEDVADR